MILRREANPLPRSRKVGRTLSAPRPTPGTRISASAAADDSAHVATAGRFTGSEMKLPHLDAPIAARPPRWGRAQGLVT
jgi:hypothetical protein